MAVPASRTTTTRTEKGVSLARGPALILGTILLVAGLYFLYKQHTFPKLSNFPNGSAPVQGKVFLGIFGANGWTGMLTAAGGGLLLFGAAQHLLAKTMSLIVGIALGAAAIIALISGNVLGLAAANHLTEIAWGACAVILLFNTVIPRRRREVVVEEPASDRRVARSAPAATAPVAERDRDGVDQAAPATAVRDRENVAGDPQATTVQDREAEDPAATTVHDRDVEATAGDPQSTTVHRREVGTEGD